MKNLVLSTLIVAAASQAAGCIIVDDDDPSTGAVRVNWTLLSTNVAVAGNPDVTVSCPPGADTVTLFALRDGDLPAEAYQDKYDCVDGTGTMTDLPTGNYTVWAQLSDFPGTTKFAESFSKDALVTTGGVATVPHDIYVDRGFFFVGWNLTGRATSCAGITNNGVSVIATDGGGAALGFEDLIRCIDGERVKTITQPLPVRSTLPMTNAQYTVAVSLLNAQNQSIGDGTTNPTGSFQNFGGATTDLGILNINVR
jgi:hypothetical protein